MIKLKLEWELENGERYEEWTLPAELADAEIEVLKGRSIIKYLRDEETPSQQLLLYLAHKLHPRVSGKPISNLESWRKKVTWVEISDFDVPKKVQRTEA